MSKLGEVDELCVLPDSIDEESSEESLLGKRRMPLRLNRKNRANVKPITTPTARLQSRMMDFIRQAASFYSPFWMSSQLSYSSLCSTECLVDNGTTDGLCCCETLFECDPSQRGPPRKKRGVSPEFERY